MRVAQWTLPLARAYRNSVATSLGLPGSRIFIASIADAWGGYVAFTYASASNIDAATFRRRRLLGRPAVGGGVASPARVLADAAPAPEFVIVSRVYAADSASEAVNQSTVTALAIALAVTPDATLYAGVPGALAGGAGEGRSGE